jgi:pimeloyl-ACP methyl ester carboxylesterase
MKHSVSYKNGHSLAYAEYGDKDGYPILINHGMIASIDDGDLFQRLVEAGRYVICLARPGYGESSPYALRHIGEWAEVVSVLINRLGLSQFDTLGMSSGAPYSYALGCRFPDRVRNIYIFSGTPALYEQSVQAHWPYPLNTEASLTELKQLARELFFSNLPEENLKQPAIRDSMMHDGFGIAQDLKIRCQDWGFTLAAVKPQVYMQHRRQDEAVPFVTAELTSKLLPNCTLEVTENGVHFSPEALDDFIRTTVLGHYQD